MQRLTAALARPLPAAALALVSAVLGVYLLRPYDRPTQGLLPGYSFATQTPITSWSDTRLLRRAGESDIELGTRLTQVVFQSYYHCDTDDGARPIDKLIYQLLPNQVIRHGFLSPANMRCGFCHQSAYLLSRALTLQGVMAWPRGLKGHVVALAQIDGKQLIFDPDFGVGPVEYSDYNPDSIRSVYAQTGKWIPELEPVYATNQDDGLYSSMHMLVVREWLQRGVTFAGESLVLALTLLSWLNLARVAAVRWRSASIRGSAHNQ